MFDSEAVRHMFLQRASFGTDFAGHVAPIVVDGVLVSLQLFGVGPCRSKRGFRQ